MTESQSAPSEAKAPTISVVIPTFNEERIISRCLRALTQQDDQPDEIIVVDNGSTDNTVSLAKQFPLVRIVAEPRSGITYARQAGFDAATCDVIARIDADTLVRSDWITRIREDFSDPHLDGQSGTAAIAELSPGKCFWFTWWYRFFRAWHERSIGVSPVLYGFNTALRRTAWEKCRKLVMMGDETVSEDLDVTIAMLRSGHRLRYRPQMVVKARLFRSLNREKLARYYATDNFTLTRHQYGNPKRWKTTSTDERSTKR